MSQGEEGCIADMKSFITHYSLRQTTVAMMTGEHFDRLSSTDFICLSWAKLWFLIPLSALVTCLCT